jgi:hypothetical protein
VAPIGGCARGFQRSALKPFFGGSRGTDACQRLRGCISRQDTFLAAYRKTSSIAAAAQAAGIKPAQHYRWLAANPAYWEAFSYKRTLPGDFKTK